MDVQPFAHNGYLNYYDITALLICFAELLSMYFQTRGKWDDTSVNG